MPRPPRVTEPGAIYHVTSRGNDGRRIFLDRVDGERFLHMLDEVAAESDWAGYAYCLMPNHVHLVVQVTERGLSAGMQKLNGGFSRWANRRHLRTGHLFHNRFYAGHVERDEHLLEACRYVALNPVRAGLCRAAEEWPWSSYAATAGMEPARPCLRLQLVLALFGNRITEALRSYRQFVASGLGPVSDTGLGAAPTEPRRPA